MLWIERRKKPRQPVSDKDVYLIAKRRVETPREHAELLQFKIGESYAKK